MRATLEESFYNVSVTPTELWLAVGRVLERARLDRKWKPIDVQYAGGPSYKTVQAIEAGDVGNVETLAKCAQVLDLSIVDVLYAVLESRLTPLSPEAAQIVRKFSETTVEGRQALLAVATAMPSAAVAAPLPPLPAGATRPPAPRPPRPARPAPPRRKPR